MKTVFKFDYFRDLPKGRSEEDVNKWRYIYLSISILEARTSKTVNKE